MSTQDLRDTSLLAIGHQCSAPSCLLVDFLPIKCQHCKLPYCSDHFKVADHACPKYDAAAHNRIAPDCPLCNKPVAVRLGQDPNERMEAHFASECTATGGRGTRSAPVCARPKCGKVLFAPIRCDSCKSQFCPKHRFPADHACATRSTTPSRDNLNSRAAAATTATVSALRKTLTTPAKSIPTAKISTPVKVLTPAAQVPVINASSQPTQAQTQSKPVANPFSKTDRRARAERESRRRALRERAQKGLLSAEEKARLEAEDAAAASEKRDCTIM